MKCVNVKNCLQILFFSASQCNKSGINISPHTLVAHLRSRRRSSGVALGSFTLLLGLGLNLG